MTPPAPRRPVGGAPRTPARGRHPRRYDAGAREKAAQVLAILKKHYGEVDCPLDHGSAFELLCAVILSAQCTDARVNLVTPALFARFPTPQAMAAAPVEELEDLVRTTGFFRNKAKALKAMAQRLVEHYGGEVPRDMEALLTLRGVARKTANVVRGHMWNLAEGVVVDTHVFRVTRRLGWTKGKTPEDVERDLMALHPRESWLDVGDYVITHGRAICVARRPRCEVCPVSALCPSSLV